MPHTWLGRTTYVLFALIALLAAWKGDRPQRWAGFVLLFADIVSPLIQNRIEWMDPDQRLLLLDIALLAFFLGLALRFGKLWMLLAAAFQLLSTLSHPAAHVARRISPFVYLFVFQFFSYGVYLTVGVAAAITAARPSQARP